MEAAAATPVRLSKSRFVAGLQCLKRLYLQVHQPQLADEPGEDLRLQQGIEVGLLAQTRFPGGVVVDFTSGAEEALARTAALLDDPSVPAIFEATFQRQGILVRVDVLQRRPKNRWRIIEVKSSLEVKEHHVYDVAIQCHVLRNCGLRISSANLMHLNRNYRYDGRAYNPRRLFTVRDLTRQVRRMDAELSRLVRVQRRILRGESPPEIPPGSQCRKPYPCEFYEHCNREPPPYHISYLPNLRRKKVEALIELGVSTIREIPDDFPLTEMQARALSAVKTGKPWVNPSLARKLRKLEYPLYFMDFESFSPALPRFKGMKPYGQIPFQWSVHRLAEVDARLEHFDFLAEDESDPREQFLESLCRVLGRSGKIVVYNAAFESERLRELAEWFPRYEHRVDRIQARLWDLWPFVRQHVYHADFNGSFSLKSVLPALVPGMSYEGMEIGGGEEAGAAWERMVRGGVDAEERGRLRKALREYCRQDTEAMVRVIERLRELM